MRNKAIQIWIYLIIPLLLVEGRVEDATVSFSLIQTTDLHANVESLGRIASLLHRLRREKGSENVLYIDCGDLLQGTVEGSWSRGELPIKAFSLLSPDVWVIGNHDLDFGGERLLELLRSYPLPAGAGNLMIGDQQFPGLFNLQRKNVRISVIALTTPYLSYWLKGKIYEKIQVKLAKEVIGQLLARSRSYVPHLLILAIHQGVSTGKTRLPDETIDLIQTYPEIDVVLCGHTHIEEPGKMLGKTWIVQAGYNGQHVAWVDVQLVIDRQNDSRRQLSIKSKLYSLQTEEIHSEFIEKIGEIWQNARYFKNQPITWVEKDINSRGIPGINNPMSEIIARAIAYVSHADVVFHGVLNTFQWRQGWLKEDDLFRTIPFENGIIVVELNREELQSVCEEQLTYGERMNGIWGVKILLDGSKKVIRFGGVSESKDRFWVAFNSYTAAGGGGRYPMLRQIVNQKSSKEYRELPFSTRQALWIYLRNCKNWSQDPVQWIEGYREVYEMDQKSN